MGIVTTTSGNPATGFDYMKGTEVEATTFTGDLTGDVTGSRTRVTEAVTATADGTGTGVISAGTDHVAVTSTDADHIVTLPSPVVGKELWLRNGATGYEIRSSDPATVAINGGADTNAESAVGANILVHLYCDTATTWIGETFTTAGVKGVLQVAAA